MHPKQCTQIPGYNKNTFKRSASQILMKTSLQSDIHISETPGIAWEPQKHHT